MTLYERIKFLCDERSIKISALAAATGISSSLFSELKSGRTRTLGSKKIEAIASYFNVSVDYLLNGGDDESSADEMTNELFRKRKLLFDKSAKASAKDLDAIIQLVDSLAGGGDEP